MTGNVVFLGFAAAGVPGFRVAPFVVAIASFMAGALIAGRAGAAHIGRSERRWLLTSALVETVALWIAAVIAIDFDVAAQAPDARLFAIIALTGVAMGYRNGTVSSLPSLCAQAANRRASAPNIFVGGPPTTTNVAGI